MLTFKAGLEGEVWHDVKWTGNAFLDGLIWFQFGAEERSKHLCSTAHFIRTGVFLQPFLSGQFFTLY